MVIGDRIRAVREAKKLSQGDVEKRSRLLRVYISRVENNHTTPSVETLEKFANALDVPLYQLFYDGEEPPDFPNVAGRKTADEIGRGRTGKEARLLERFGSLLGRMDESHRLLLLFMAKKMARR